jgi:peptidoglycan L-alanyl-D-glutamate endopeptidase CwlK
MVKILIGISVGLFLLAPVMGNTRLDAALSDFNSKIPLIMQELKDKGWKPKIHKQFRSIEKQREKVRKGHSTTMNSYHLCGLAVDIIDKRYGWSGPAADINYEFWKDLGKAANKQGLVWGGDWKSFKDVAHVQYIHGCKQ